MEDELLHSVRLQISGDQIHISRRLIAPECFTYAIEVHEDLNLPAKVALDCSWSPKIKRYKIDRLDLTPLDGGEPISSHLLRKIQVGAILEAATRSHLIRHARVVTDTGSISTTRAMDHFSDEQPRLKAGGPSSRETLEWVSLIYEIAATENAKPAQAVSYWFEISIRTATNWVKAAREQGLLDNG